jgi:hypothetical protein
MTQQAVAYSTSARGLVGPIVEDHGADAFGLNNPLTSGCYIAAPTFSIAAAASYRTVTVAARESTLRRYQRGDHPRVATLLRLKGKNAWPFDRGTLSGGIQNVARLVRRTGQAVALAGCLALVSLATPAFAVPPGNNGTIKLDDVAFDDHPNNEPHVGCTFQVDFYGYDEGDLFADVTFRAHPPTGDREVLVTDKVFIGEDDNSAGEARKGSMLKDLHSGFQRDRTAPAARLPPQADHRSRRLAGCRRQAQGVLGTGMRADTNAHADTHEDTHG